MSMFKVNIVARNTKDESQLSQPTEVLVDTGSGLTWLPKDLLTGINIKPVRKRNFTQATKQIVTRETGYAILSAEGFETVDEVVFAEPSDMARREDVGGFRGDGGQHRSSIRRYDDHRGRLPSGSLITTPECTLRRRFRDTQ